MKLILLIAALFSLTQTPSQLSSVVGTVVAIEKTSKTVTIKTDQNASILIKAVDTNRLLTRSRRSTITRTSNADSV